MAKLIDKDGMNLYIESAKKRFGKKKSRRRYHQSWDLDHIRAYYDRQTTTEYTVDDATWNDLDMDKAYKQVDRTTNSCGQYVLYDWLRRTLSSIHDLSARESMIKTMQKDDTKERVLDIFDNLGHVRSNVQAVLSGQFEVPYKTYMLSVGMPILLIISVVMIAFTSSAILIPVILALLIGSVVIHYYVNQNQENYKDSIFYMVRIIVAAKKLSKVLEKDMPELSQELKVQCDQCKNIQRKARVPMNLDLMKAFFLIGYVSELLDYLFLFRTRNSYKLSKEIKKKSENLNTLFRLVGEIDAAQSVATVRHLAGIYCVPTFSESEHVLKVKGVFTPLLADPVANDIDFGHKGMMLTGSNMSGKSTYLRSVGQNVIFAQSIHTCFAESYHASLYHVMSSIRINDDITQGASYYFSEAKRVLEIVHTVEKDTPALVIIDEMLRGTNDTERRHICIEVLNRLAQKNCKVIIATHDTSIAPELYDYDYRYFHSIVVDGDLRFEYHMQHGVCPDGNAVDVIDYLDYPEDIVVSIRKKIEEEEKAS